MSDTTQAGTQTVEELRDGLRDFLAPKYLVGNIKTRNQAWNHINAFEQAIRTAERARVEAELKAAQRQGAINLENVRTITRGAKDTEAWLCAELDKVRAEVESLKAERARVEAEYREQLEQAKHEHRRNLADCVQHAECGWQWREKLQRDLNCERDALLCIFSTVIATPERGYTGEPEMLLSDARQVCRELKRAQSELMALRARLPQTEKLQAVYEAVQELRDIILINCNGDIEWLAGPEQRLDAVEKMDVAIRAIGWDERRKVQEAEWEAQSTKEPTP